MNNTNILCNVKECKHHSKDENFCTLSKIQVIKHSNEAHCPECTDCGSFENC